MPFTVILRVMADFLAVNRGNERTVLLYNKRLSFFVLLNVRNFFCFVFRCSLLYIDFEGRSDGESIKRILSLVNPRNLVSSCPSSIRFMSEDRCLLLNPTLTDLTYLYNG